MSIARAAFVFLLAPALLVQLSAQENKGKEPASSIQQQQQAQPNPSQRDDALAQMRDDLTRLESLNNVMSSEIELLHDQNLQILLRTNSQMWTVLIRDLRRQVDREAQRGTK